MAKTSKQKGAAPRKPVARDSRSPCGQDFNVSAKPGRKTRSWWNGYTKPSPRDVAE